MLAKKMLIIVAVLLIQGCSSLLEVEDKGPVSMWHRNHFRKTGTYNSNRNLPVNYETKGYQRTDKLF